MFNFFKKNTVDNKNFDILNPETWDYASDTKEIKWNNNKLLDKDGNPLTEKDVVDLVRSIFKFLERKGDLLTLDKKITAIKNLLNRIENPEYYAKQYEQEKEEFDKNIPDGKFNVRDPKTWEYAKYNKPLIIDGIRIFRTHTDSTGKEVKEDETEKGFIDILSMLLKIKISENAAIWDTAIKQAHEEYREKGIKNPNDKTPGYLDRVNEVYQSKLNNLNDNEKDQEYDQAYINKYIKQKIAECSPKKFVKYGGYDFSEAQLEVLSECSKDKLIKIGEIIASGRKNNKRSYQIKQDYFNSMGWDAYYFVQLDSNKGFPELEERTMQDYYASFEFDTEEEAVKYFNENPYLSKHPELKKIVIENKINLFREMRKFEEENILINKGNNVTAIKKGQPIPDGWTLYKGQLEK